MAGLLVDDGSLQDEERRVGMSLPFRPKRDGDIHQQQNDGHEANSQAGPASSSFEIPASPTPDNSLLQFKPNGDTDAVELLLTSDVNAEATTTHSKEQSMPDLRVSAQPSVLLRPKHSCAAELLGSTLSANATSSQSEEKSTSDSARPAEGTLPLRLMHSSTIGRPSPPSRARPIHSGPRCDCTGCRHARGRLERSFKYFNAEYYVKQIRPFRLMALPREVRFNILGFVLCKPVIEIAPASDCARYFKRFAALHLQGWPMQGLQGQILRVCRALLMEGTTVTDVTSSTYH